jgi:hypothetical protein
MRGYGVPAGWGYRGGENRETETRLVQDHGRVEQQLIRRTTGKSGAAHGKRAADAHRRGRHMKPANAERARRLRFGAEG